MKKVRLLVLALVIAVSLVGCSGGSSVQREKNTLLSPYSDRYFGIMYPTEFETFSDEDVFMAKNPDEPSFWLAVVRIEEHRYNPTDLLRLFSEYYAEDIEEDTQKELISTNKSTLHGQTAYYIYYKNAVYGKEDEKRLDVLSAKGNNVFILAFNSKLSKFDDRMDLFNEIIKQFEILY